MKKKTEKNPAVGCWNSSVIKIINFWEHSLTWSVNCVISSATEATKSTITDTKLYVVVVTLLT